MRKIKAIKSVAKMNLVSKAFSWLSMLWFTKYIAINAKT
jgi:hypothetical protein